MKYLVPIGRVLFASIFILSGIKHFSMGMVLYAQQQGVPMASTLVPLSGFLAVVGGVLIAFGYQARIGGALIALFLIPVTFMMHNFWAFEDPAVVQQQMAHFMKNLSMLGGALLIVYHGNGPGSLEPVNRPLSEDLKPATRWAETPRKREMHKV